jgi:HEPN domain-containing protein
MKHKNSVYPKDWMQIAEKDFTRVQKLLDINDFVAAGFYLQQSAEKFLKAYLLERGWHLRRLHDLEILINEAIKFDIEFEKYRSVCQLITSFYFTERYPFFVDTELNENDVIDSYKYIIPMVTKIRNEFK